MPNTISRYILQRVLVYLFAMTGLALLALLLERMFRVMGIITNWEGGVAVVARLMLNLVPHYLGMALPDPSFLRVPLTFYWKRTRLNSSHYCALHMPSSD